MDPANPLVTVICLCYNHERFLEAAIESVAQQSYRPVQIIVYDDASTDNSPAVIEQMKARLSGLQVVLSTQNQGNCRAFNQAYALARGEFIVDFSTDDVMHPKRLERQVDFFKQCHAHTGVVFTDATYMDDAGKPRYHHYQHLLAHGLLKRIAVGDVFRDVVTTFYIASPTMMIRRSVLDQLNGYDEDLAYEDFDLWVRSSKICEYAFLNDRLTLIRKTSTSLSTKAYRHGDKQLMSTYLVCRKAWTLCENDGDRAAVSQRVRYELRHAALSGNHKEGRLFWELLNTMQTPPPSSRFWNIMNVIRLPLTPLYHLYLRTRY